jgi:predicted Zn-dependent peptidase
MTQVRSISIGVWLTRGSRHEAAERSGIAHFVEHMLFKGTTSRSAEDIAQAIDSIGGQLDAFTAKEYASYYIKVLDEHLPLAIDILSDIVRNPAFSVEDLEREKKVVVEEIKMVEDTPDDLVHELFTQGFGRTTRWGVRLGAGNCRVVRRRFAARIFQERVHRPESHRLGGWQS